MNGMDGQKKDYYDSKEKPTPESWKKLVFWMACENHKSDRL